MSAATPPPITNPRFAVFSKFFIDRPIFAAVLSVLIMIAGAVAYAVLPVAQFPEVVPPTVSIVASYPGADAKTVSDTVAAPIEQQLSGANKLLYFQSTCGNDGSLRTTVTFEVGTDLDLAQVDVQNRVNQATAKLPEEVRRQGVMVLKRSNNMVQVAVLTSDNPAHDQLFLSNYATINLLDVVKRVPGIGDAMVYGSGDYAMRVWLDPDKLAARNLTVTDVRSAIVEQNGLYAAGAIGQRPGPAGIRLTVPVTTRGRLDSPEQFAKIILRSESSGAVVRLEDVGRVELGSGSYDVFGRHAVAGKDKEGRPSTLIITYLQDGANAVEVAKATKRVLADAEAAFPVGMKCTIPFDSTRFIEVSIDEVLHTLRDAILLVLVVVFLFLQNWRTTLIPLLAVPVSVIGTFAGLLLLGFSVNTLTLFGLVLAIGIVVDDAIVVVENVERIMATTGKSVRDATVQAMEEVSGPVVGIVLVMCAVFVPVAFLGGLTGRFYQQFALTISVSVIISGFVALTLSPALCRLLLKPHDSAHAAKPGLAGRFFGAFNRGFDRVTAHYTGLVGSLMRRLPVSLGIIAVLMLATWGLFKKVPAGFIPAEDQGYVVAQVILPEGASLDRTDALLRKAERHFLEQPAVEHVITMGGMNFLSGGNATNAGVLFVILKDWSLRKTPETGIRALLGGAYARFATDTDGLVLPFNPPPVPGLGTRIGFEFQLQDRGNHGQEELAKVSADLLARLGARPEITGSTIVYSYTQPRLFVDVDREQVKAMGLNVSDVFATLQAQLGSLYVNDFNKFGRVWKVQLQAEPAFRASPESIGRMYVRNGSGDLLPLSAVISSEWRSAPNMVTRFQGYPAVTVTGGNAEGVSSGEAMAAVEEVVKSLPPGYAIEWSGSSLQERQAGSQAGMILAFGMVIVFLVLAAQYESLRLPLIVMLTVPFGLLGTMAACAVSGLPNDIFIQIGILVLVGLAAKNAILIVEFAAERVAAGMSVREAALEAARLRFRPILMTSFAFILGVVPLMVSSGAGAAGRVTMGIGVFGGMLAATGLAVLLVPVYFRLIAKPAQDANERPGEAPRERP